MNEIIYVLICINNHVLSCLISMLLTKRFGMVVEYTQCHVKTKSKLINFKIN